MSFARSNDSILKVPWEPYKAATDKNLNIISIPKHSLTLTTSSLSHNLSNSSTNSNNNLIKYKIETNLDLFNMNRPGYQFDDFDITSIKEINSQTAVKLTKNTIETIRQKSISTTIPTKLANDLALNENNNSDDNNKLPPNFIDARFYTDAHFLKLANQLKKKTIDSSSNMPNSNTFKPVNVVGPLVEKKKESIDEHNSTSTATPYGADKNSIKYWKAQQQQYEIEIEYLKSQICGINEQLQIQTQVNVELKKLLVASIGGEDIQYKMERLVNDKLRYEHELSNNTKLIEKLNEDIEQISIQCDLWRSKFLASKLMSEENSTWKSFLLLLSFQNENVIKNLVSDNELLNEKLNQALDILINYNNSTGVNDKAKFKSKSSNNFQAANLLLANLNNLCKSKDIKKPRDLSVINSTITNKTYQAKTLNEMIASQMLEQFNWLKTAAFQVHSNLKLNTAMNTDAILNNLNVIDSLEKLEKLIQRIKLTRTNSYGRLFQSIGPSETDLFLNVCNKCKGQVKVV